MGAIREKRASGPKELQGLTNILLAKAKVAPLALDSEAARARAAGTYDCREHSPDLGKTPSSPGR